MSAQSPVIDEKLLEEVRQDLANSSRSQYSIVRDLTEQGYSEEEAHQIVDQIIAELFPNRATTVSSEDYEQRLIDAQDEQNSDNFIQGGIYIVIGIVIAILGALEIITPYAMVITLGLFFFGGMRIYRGWQGSR